MITCQTLFNSASDYVESTDSSNPVVRFSLKQRISIRFHLLLCKYCRLYLKQIRLTSRTASALTVEVTPTDQEIERLVQRLKQLDD